jgi:hypothetical protein
MHYELLPEILVVNKINISVRYKQNKRFACFTILVRLHEVFDRLKFKIDSQDNMRRGDMDRILKKYANKDHTDMDCFVCCILSHGNKDGVVSCDEKCVSIETITSYFRASSCPSLAGKPKLFFFQACKGIVHMDGEFLKHKHITHISYDRFKLTAAYFCRFRYINLTFTIFDVMLLSHIVKVVTKTSNLFLRKEKILMK